MNRKKLIKICAELTEEERIELLTILQEGEFEVSTNFAKRKFPAEAAEIEYNGGLIDP